MKMFIPWKRTALALEKALQMQTAKLVAIEKQWHRTADGQPVKPGFYSVITRNSTARGYRYCVTTDLYVSNPDTETGWVLELGKSCDVVAWHDEPFMPEDLEKFLRG